MADKHLIRSGQIKLREPRGVVASCVAWIAIISALFFSSAYASERRVALVIGNSRYNAVPALKNTTRDADLVSIALRELGFESVTVAVDLPLVRMVDILRRFGGTAENADWAMIYYAGHGLEINGMNYLLPVDANLAVDRDVSFEAVSLSQVLVATEGAKKLRLVFLDACRENPFVSRMRRSIASRNLSRGLARIEPEGGTIVMYAAKDGQIAWDGAGQNSPFTSAFLRHVKTPDLELNRLFRRIRSDVTLSTNNAQEPFVYGSLPDEDFFFARAEDRRDVQNKGNVEKSNASVEAKNLKLEQEKQAETVSPSRVKDQSLANLNASSSHNAISAQSPSNIKTQSGEDPDLARDPLLGQKIQIELKRLGCGPKSASKIWNREADLALKNYSKFAKHSIDVADLGESFLRQLRTKEHPVCKFDCGDGMEFKHGGCIEKKCGPNKYRSNSGACMPIMHHERSKSDTLRQKPTQMPIKKIVEQRQKIIMPMTPRRQKSQRTKSNCVLFNGACL